MLKRIISGAVYVAVIVGFFFLRAIDRRLFGILIYAFSIIGTYEMVQAFSRKRVSESGEELPPEMGITLSQKIAVFVYVAVFTPSFYLVEHFAPAQGFRVLLVLSFTYAVVIFCLLVIDYKNTDLKNTGAALICAFYPTAILSTMILANAFKTASALALLLIFVISPVADTFAFLMGSLLKGKKLCPNISPNKTIAGAVGGVVFGTVASVVLYCLYTLVVDYTYAGIGNPWVTFAVIGMLTSLMTEFGDLVESVIKRKLGIKDMGKIMPGHGGILDRIDGTLFASLFVYIVFSLFIV